MLITAIKPQEIDKTHRPDLAALKATVATIEGRTAQLQPDADRPKGLGFGLDTVDGCLPQTGLSLGAVHDIAALKGAEGSATSIALLLAARSPDMPLVWITTRQGSLEQGLIYGPGLDDMGVAANRVMLVRTRDRQEALWAAEESLSSKAQPLVVLDMLGLSRDSIPDLTESRRLTLTAGDSGATAILLTSGLGPHENRSSMAVETRWLVTAGPSAGGQEKQKHLVQDPAATLTLLKARQSNGIPLPASWSVTWPASRRPFISTPSGQEKQDAATLSMRLVPSLRAEPLAADISSSDEPTIIPLQRSA